MTARQIKHHPHFSVSARFEEGGTVQYGFQLWKMRAAQRFLSFVTMNCGLVVSPNQGFPGSNMANKPAFAQGAQVEHPKFGLGSVMSCSEDYIVIKFDDHGEKKFVLSIVLPNLKKSDRQPPVEKRRSTKKKTPVAAS